MNPLEIQTNPGTAETVLFYLLAGMLVGFSIFAMTRRNPVAAVMSLVGAFVSLAGIYATMAAHFVAVLQVLVYAGAIMVLFIFVVMILNREEITPVSFRGIFTRVIGAAAIVWLFAFVGVKSFQAAQSEVLEVVPAPAAPGFGTVRSVGERLFTEFVFPFEAISVLLLVAIVGGIVVSRSAKQEADAENDAAELARIRRLISPVTRLDERGQPVGDDSNQASHAPGHH